MFVIPGSVLAPSRFGNPAAVLVPTPPLLLDLIATAATAAYSTRKLLAAYAGSAMRVRRSSDNSEQDIGFVGNDLDTASLLSFTGAGNGFVTKWYDQSGSARDQVQATAGNQPQIVSSGSVITTINGVPSIKFDGTASKLLGAAALSAYLTANNYTLMGLSRPAAATASGNDSDPDTTGALFNDPATDFFMTGFAANFMAAHFDGSAYKIAIATATYPNVYVTTSRYDHSNVTARLNGGAGTSTAAANGVSNLTGLAGIGKGFNAAAYFNGTQAEFITFNSALSKADMNTLGANMATRGGASWTTIP